MSVYEPRVTGSCGYHILLVEPFEKFQAVVDETVPSIIAYSAAHVNGVSKKVEGFHSTPMLWLELKDVSLKP